MHPTTHLFNRPTTRSWLPAWATGALLALALLPAYPAFAQDAPGHDDDIPDGWRLIEGDILVREGDEGGIAGTYSNNFWPNGVVPYILDDNVSATNQQRALDAMAEIEAIADVDWRPYVAGDTAWVRIRNSTRNNSAVGRQGGEQILNMTSWTNKFIIVHEMYHALGFWHEQSRADRALYVIINYGNIQSGQSGNFDIRPNGGEYGAYDFDSLMHYDKCSFSTDCPIGTTCACSAGTETIQCLPAYASQQDLMGQRDHLSYMDRTTMSFIYPFDNWRFCDIDWNGFQFGTFFFPYKTFLTGFDGTPSGGTLWIQPGTYAGVGTWDKAITLRAPLGGVTLNN